MLMIAIYLITLLVKGLRQYEERIFVRCVCNIFCCHDLRMMMKMVAVMMMKMTLIYYQMIKMMVMIMMHLMRMMLRMVMIMITTTFPDKCRFGDWGEWGLCVKGNQQRIRKVIDVLS